MAGNNFDGRYPVIFQPGGVDHATNFVDPEEPQKNAPDPAGSGQQPLRTLSEYAVTGLTNPGPAQAEAPGTDTPETDASDAGLGADIEGTVSESRWTARTWAVGLGAIAITFAAAAFCLVAVALIPSASSVDPSTSHGIMVIAWGYAIIPGAPALLAAALALLAGILFLGSRQHRRQAIPLWAGGAIVGLVALSIGIFALFGATLMPEIYYDPSRWNNPRAIPWPAALQRATAAFIVLGLIILAIAAVAPPRRNGTPGIPSGKRAVVVGVFLTAAGVWSWFASQLYPLALGQEIQIIGGQEYSQTPWPMTVAETGGSLVMVGAGVLLWGVLLLALRGPREQDALEAASSLE